MKKRISLVILNVLFLLAVNTGHPPRFRTVESKSSEYYLEYYY